MPKATQIGHDVLEVLDRARIEGTKLFLIDQLDRKLYERTNKVLVAAGGQWNRKEKAHVFASDAAERVDEMILTGRYERPSDFGRFWTPPNIVDIVMDRAKLDATSVVLEPSAGLGNIARRAAEITNQVHCVEIGDEQVSHLRSSGPYASVVQGDFLEIPPCRVFSHLLMNPPFAGQADVRHVEHALQFLRPGGRLVSIMSAGLTFRMVDPTRSFRERLERLGAIVEMLPAGSFTPSGTDVHTCIVSLTMH